jgi:hypothetical protein
MKSNRLFQAVAALAVVGLAACSSDPVSPGLEPQITNLTDDFAYQVSDVQNHTSTDSYTWQNTGTGASVDQSTSLTSGSATLVLLDGAGVQVYSRSLSESGSSPTATGAAGTWTIRIVYESTVSPAVNFRAQKLTP